MDMGGSADPAQTNIIAAHGAHVPDGGRTAGGRTAIQFDLLHKNYHFGARGAAWGPMGPMGPMGHTGPSAPSRRPAASGGGVNLVHQTDAINQK